jgi:ParB-like chromosome segregation protein Spo0J
MSHDCLEHSILSRKDLEHAYPIEWRAPHLLVPHPRHAAIYGEEEDVTDLVEAIRVSGWIKPILITQQDKIIRGHRCWKAASMLGWHAVPVERRVFADVREEVEVMLLENCYRTKTPEQRVREAEEWRRLEQQRAAQRQKDLAGTRSSANLQEKFPEGCLDRGQTRDKVAERVGLGSGRTYEKAARVVQIADTLAEQGKAVEAQTLLTVLNEQSIDAAAQLLKLDEKEQTAVLQKLAEGEQKKVKAALIEVRQEAVERQVQATPSKPRITLANWRDWLPAQPPCDLLFTDPPYSTDVEDIAAFAHAWLPLALSKVKPTGRAYICIGAYPHELRAYLQVPTPLPLEQVLVWSYLNTIGPAPTHTYKQNWQAILYYRGASAPPLDCPLLIEQMSAMQLNAPDGRQGERYHAWQKPDALAERLIRHATRPGDLILDCFAGTGTFVLAAHRLGRRALGCDHSPEMLAIARRRGCEIEEVSHEA